MRNFWIFACVIAMLLFALSLSAQTVQDYDNAGVHAVVNPVTDDPDLLAGLQVFIQHAKEAEKETLCLSVRKIEKRHVMLVVQHGHPELAHWLDHDQQRVWQSLAESSGIGSLFVGPSRESDIVHAKFLLRLKKEIEQNFTVRSVSFWEMDFQKAFCPYCNPAKRPAYHPKFCFSYPTNLSMEEFVDMVAELGIDIAMPAAGRDGVLRYLPPHSYAMEVKIIDPGPRIIKKRLIWNPLLREKKLDGMFVELEPDDAAYASSRSILENCGMWNDSSLEKRILHCYSDELVLKLDKLWQERHKHEANLVGDQTLPLPTEANFSFRKDNETWTVALTNLR